jgi:hypothetical protein
MPKYDGLEDDDYILIDPETGHTMRVPANRVQNWTLDIEPANAILKIAAGTIEDAAIGKDILTNIKKSVNEWIEEQE